MPHSAASRRRVRPTFAAAVLCGLLGGSLTGLGAFGFDGAPAAAADKCYGLGAPPSTGTVAPTPAAAEEPDSAIAPDPIPAEPAPIAEDENTSLEPTDPGSEPATDSPAPIGGDVTADPFPDLTTTAPLICPPHGAAPVTAPTPELPSLEPSPTVDPVEVPPVAAPPVQVLPTPSPMPAPAPATPPQPDDDDPELGVPVLGKPTEIGVSGRGMPRTPTPGRTGTISRPEVIARAVSWVTQKVPYSQSRWWTDSAGTFRQDCSGYVSMAWRTDQRINYWTGNLARISDRISSPALRPGDLLNLAGKHVVIFAGWEDAAKTKFRLFEQYATGHTPRFVRNAPLSYYLSRGYGAYRYEGITEAAAVRVTAPRRLSTPIPAPAATSSHHQSIALVAASSDVDPAVSPPPGTQIPPTPESLLVGLPATTWSPAVAEQYTADNTVTQTLPAGSTPSAAEIPSPAQLVAEQRAIDTGEPAEALLAQTARAVEPTSPAGVLLALGLGLLFVAVPLAAAARGRIWAPVVTPFDARPGG
ncbi:hypothetical protein [Sporichthya polymorpha]|uniref:hypothetical protein n=1 Tax=Sporichthya polymorpha TaxID=35751 RepID=UPI0003A1E4C6|nr:hypothetical protein [Sporichthya polymorpha]